MTSWTEGYVSDIPYSLGFYRETAPQHLAFAALAVGNQPAAALKPQRVLELGFGMGLGLVLAAAAMPATAFEGVDFNPQHVVHARGLAEGAGLTNITLREASFQDLAREAAEGQHDVDVIVLHGILTWVSAEAHAAIVEIARKRLKPGGFLYVSYNCMPGWAPVLPMQRLMREQAKRLQGRSDQQTAAGLDLLKALTTEGARYFAANPALAPRIEKMGGLDRHYLAHEYLNANWFIFHFADVAAMLADAKLTFLASATIGENIDVVSVPEAMRQRVAEATDPVWKETLRDFAGNKQFRRDIFVRGTTALSAHEARVLQDGVRFALTVPRDKVSFKIQSPMGDLDAHQDIYGPIADLLSMKVMSFAEIAALPVFAQGGRAAALQAMAVLVHSGQVLPIMGEGAIDVAPAQRFNRMVAAHMQQGRAYNFLAAPLAGSGVPATHQELLMLGAVLAGAGTDAGALTEHSLGAMRRLGISPLKDGAAVTDPAEQRALIGAEAETFLTRKLPLWQRLGVL